MCCNVCCVQDERSRPLVNCVWMALHNELLSQLSLELSHHSAPLVCSPAAAAPPSSSSDFRAPERANATRAARVAACLRSTRSLQSSSSSSADAATAARTVSQRSPDTAETEKPTNAVAAPAAQRPTRKPHERVSVSELRAPMKEKAVPPHFLRGVDAEREGRALRDCATCSSAMPPIAGWNAH